MQVGQVHNLLKRERRSVQHILAPWVHDCPELWELLKFMVILSLRTSKPDPDRNLGPSPLAVMVPLTDPHPCATNLPNRAIVAVTTNIF